MTIEAPEEVDFREDLFSSSEEESLDLDGDLAGDLEGDLDIVMLDTGPIALQTEFLRIKLRPLSGI